MASWLEALLAAMQAWDTPLPVLLVMAAGITAGSIIKSITGFGSTIAHLCIWSVARALEIPSGTLQQAVVTEVIFRTVTALPYLRMTDARRTANLKLVVSVSLFQTIGSPVGAWLLYVLDQRSLELSLAAALFAVLLVQWVSYLLFTPQPAQPAGKEVLADDAGDDSDLTAPLLKDSVAAAAALNDCVVVVDETGSIDHKGEDASKAGSAQPHKPSGSSEPELQDKDGLRTWLVLLAAGSVAGTLSGVMGGLTGIDGPPTIFMFTWLHADKAVVRGTNAVINCLLMAVLLISYGIHGIFTWRDMPLYIVGSVFGWAGTVWGNSISGLMSQLAFQRLLNGMVILCAGFMLVSALAE